MTSAVAATFQLARQISGSPCIRDTTWGVDRRGLWVDRGLSRRLPRPLSHTRVIS